MDGQSATKIMKSNDFMFPIVKLLRARTEVNL